MNYVLKNEQLFIELCRGPDFNRDSGVVDLFCNYLGSEKSLVSSETGFIGTSVQFSSHRVGNVCIRKFWTGFYPAGGLRMRTLTEISKVYRNVRVADERRLSFLSATWREYTN